MLIDIEYYILDVCVKSNLNIVLFQNFCFFVFSSEIFPVFESKVIKGPNMELSISLFISLVILFIIL